jgi:1,4-alpha-glucan branching enzyme
MFEKLGSHKTGDEICFNVWAPHAGNLDVLVQSGTEWDYTSEGRRYPLTKNQEGYWNGKFQGIAAGEIYRYEIKNNGSRFFTIDPASRDTVHSWNYFGIENNRNASIIQPEISFNWNDYNTPGFENFLIYQTHVGSFVGRNDEFNKRIGTFRDFTSKLGYIKSMNFTAIQLLPIQEFAAERSWGYNPALFFSLESVYGEPDDLRFLVNEAHKQDLAVIFDVVFNHAGPQDNSLWQFDGYGINGGIYFEGGQMTSWGQGPAWWKPEVQDFFYKNACMYFDEYNADGLRFDSTTQINGNHLAVVIGRLREKYPDKYLIAEHLPAHPWITTAGNFCATWNADAHHECQRALSGSDSVNRILRILGWDGFDRPWNLVKYTLGSHDDNGDQENGNAERGLSDWDSRHRYFVDLFGGRNNWHARAKSRLAWALNIAMPGTPLMFMGSECCMASPHVSWGYWHDGDDMRGDHRFNWAAAGDPNGIEMRNLVSDSNAVRLGNDAMRSETLDITHVDHANNIIAFKRWSNNDNIILTIVNLGETSFENHSYGVGTGQDGYWDQVLCTQDSRYGGWEGAGNAYYRPVTQADGRIYLNIPKWSVLLMKWMG